MRELTVVISIMLFLTQCNIFSSEEDELLTDVDGNTYRTVVIGNQKWMAENLKVTHFRDGSAIPTNLSDDDWESTTSGAYAIYPHDNVEGISSKKEMMEVYGALYNWHTVTDNRGLCPEGWHVPSDKEWADLMNHISGEDSLKGMKLKSRRQINSPLEEEFNTENHPRWISNEQNYGTDDFGFSGLPSGSRTNLGFYNNIGWFVSWWSTSEHNADSTTAMTRRLNHNSSHITVYRNGKQIGNPVRCLKD